MNNLELNTKMVRGADLNNYDDGRRLIANLPQEGFDKLVTLMNTTTTGDQWFDYLLSLYPTDEPVGGLDPFDNDN